MINNLVLTQEGKDLIDEVLIASMDLEHLVEPDPYLLGLQRIFADFGPAQGRLVDTLACPHHLALVLWLPDLCALTFLLFDLSGPMTPQPGCVAQR